MNTYGWTPPPVGGPFPHPQQTSLRRDAGFIGAAFLLMLGLLQTVFSLILTALAMVGVADLRVNDGRYGLGNVGFLLAYMVAYALIMGLPGPLTAAFSRLWINPFAGFDDAEERPLRFSSLLLALLGGFVAPIFAPLGFGDWRASTALLTGFTAKESVVSTLTLLLGGDTSQITTLFTPFTAAVFLVFVLLYTPCVAAIATVKRELGSARAAAATVLIQCAIAWVMAFLVRSVGLLFGLA